MLTMGLRNYVKKTIFYLKFGQESPLLGAKFCTKFLTLLKTSGHLFDQKNFKKKKYLRNGDLA